jgi:hypothetical protein
MDKTRDWLNITEKNLGFHQVVYNLFYTIPLTSLIVTSIVYPTPIYCHISFFMLTYLQEQILFMLNHVSLHVRFNYSKPTIEDMGCFCYGIGYVHHYFDPLLYSKMNFYSYCNQYIESVHSSSSLVNLYNCNKEYYMLILLPFSFVISDTYIFLYLSAVTYNLSLIRYAFFFLVAHLMKINDINNTYICMYTAYQIIQVYLQAITHLWYHTPESKKKIHFGRILWSLMAFLEKMKIVSSDEHKIHHSHNIHSLTHVEMWNDLYVPIVLNGAASNVFKYLIDLDVTNEKKISFYETIKIFTSVTTVFTFTYLAMLFC